MEKKELTIKDIEGLEGLEKEIGNIAEDLKKEIDRIIEMIKKKRENE